MDIEEFRIRGKEMVEYICNCMNNIHKRRVTPDIGPGYLRPLLPSEAPQQPEAWEDIMKDVESKIMPGITHWQHPRFHAYFPAGNSFPSILGDMLSDAIGCIGFSWASSPACTELETIVCDWFGKAIGLPKDFLYFSEGSKGGGVIQGSASECILVCMLAARAQAIARLKESPGHAHLDETVLLGKLMAYCSRESHSSVEKDAMISFVKLRILEPDEKSVLRGETLRQDVMDELADIREKKRKATLEQRRSFFVRMVSDPAIQPGFTKTPNRTGAKLDTQATIGGIGTNSHTGTRSWISWPLAYLKHARDGTDTSELSLRFRHLDTMVRLKTSGAGSRRGSSNGCSPEPSPTASPSRGRSPNGRT